jgi:hypothetical protein
VPALNFKARFAPMVEDGSKLQTLRAPRGDGRDPRPDDRLYLYTGMRTKACRKLGDAICTNVRAITLTDGAIVMAGNALTDPEDLDWFARLDGFTDWADMRTFFRLPWSGYVITWHDFKRSAGG